MSRWRWTSLRGEDGQPSGYCFDCPAGPGDWEGRSGLAWVVVCDNCKQARGDTYSEASTS